MILRQFKLTSNEEIICEIVNTEDDDSSVIVARKILKINTSEDFESGIRYYSFKPWVSFQDRIDDLTIVSFDQIIGQTTPSKTLLKHYDVALKEIEKAEETDNKLFNYDDLIEEYGDLSIDELESVIRDRLSEANTPQDSDQPNIIKFDPNRRFH